MTALPLSALLATWLDAVRAGLTGPDELASAVRGDAPRHLVVGLPGREPLELLELPSAVTGQISIALPVPGDLVGLAGPPSTNSQALEAGESVVVGAVALVPEDDARTIVWRAHPANPAPYVDERDAAARLRIVLAEATSRLVALDVASWRPEIPDLLLNLRHRPPLPLPPEIDTRRRETVERAVLCLEVVDLARRDEGGAVSAHEARERAAALGDLAQAARHALVGACTGRS